MKKAIGFLLGPIVAVFIVGLLVTPQPKIQHQDSSAFQVALQQAVDRLEGSTMFLAGTATPVNAAPQQPTFDGSYTCDTYDEILPTCNPVVPGCGPGVMPDTFIPRESRTRTVGWPSGANRHSGNRRSRLAGRFVS